MDLKKLKNILFENIELVLSNLDMEFEVQGTNIYSNCPIHEGSDNPTAFSLCTERQIWRCWTRSCHEDHGTDILSLIMAVLSTRENRECTFSEALKWCCDLLNIDNKGVNVKKEKKPNDFVKMVRLGYLIQSQSTQRLRNTKRSASLMSHLSILQAEASRMILSQSSWLAIATRRVR